MNNFIKLNWYFFHSITIHKVNGLIYFAKKLPFLGQHISDTIYKDKVIKNVFSVLVSIFSFLTRTLLSALIVGIFAVAFSVLDGLIHSGRPMGILEKSQAQAAILAMLLITVVLKNSFNLFYGAISEDILDFITYFQLSYVKTVTTLSFYKELNKLFFYLLPLFTLATLAKAQALNCLLTYIAFQLFFFTLAQFLSRKTIPSRLPKSLKLGLFSTLCLIFIGLFLVFYLFIGTAVLFSLPLALLLLVMSAFFIRQILLFKGEKNYIETLVSSSYLAVDERAIVKLALKTKEFNEGIAMQKKLTYNGQQNFGKGTSMLNKLLFYRYKDTLYKGIYKRLALFGLFLLLVIAAALISFVNGKLLFTIDENDLLIFFPGLFFLMYCIGYGKKIVQMCFLNCDSALLYYPFYRKSQTILSGFNERFKKTFMLNGIIILCIFADTLILCLIFGNHISPNFYLILILFLIALNFLFSFHELFVYYLLQPYTSDLNVVNPVYRFISWIFYMICYTSLQIHPKGYIFLAILTIISLLYVSIGYLIIKRYAPKTFRFKI
ncbi:hypothetical protein Hs30E_03280 [Lactococcus hodotermopsidis]|uniref:Uncharacterized protein n=1 Tax=Pseudolactococcus hodotermopsidis TaxID=2709157 RepID=A0A6A0BD81_9LACT|nr:hypothetical protein [Lactococcus hodotermopsidis]GFH41777.1 hypothetical protein Hs30E_03280 [Lactococcus hodotermopsidis]